MAKKQTEVDPATAAATIEADKKRRCDQAGREIDAICERLGVQLVAVVQIVSNTVASAVQIFPKP